MMKLTNNANRALGVPGARRSLVIRPKQTVQIDAADLDAIKKNKTSSRWLRSGILTIGDAPPEKEEPKKDDREKDLGDESPKAEVEVRHAGGGWYEVFVSGIDVSQGRLRKEEAEALAAQYQNNQGGSDGEA